MIITFFFIFSISSELCCHLRRNSSVSCVQCVAFKSCMHCLDFKSIASVYASCKYLFRSRCSCRIASKDFPLIIIALGFMK